MADEQKSSEQMRKEVSESFKNATGFGKKEGSPTPEPSPKETDKGKKND